MFLATTAVGASGIWGNSAIDIRFLLIENVHFSYDPQLTEKLKSRRENTLCKTNSTQLGG